ncbi:MAG: glutaredoxin domain-containing protein [Anaerolineaceae bacterium]
MEDTTHKILLYATTWCYQSRNTRSFLDQHQVDYEFIDIDKDKAGEAFVLKTNNGYRSVPTLLFPDGTTLTEPSQSELSKKLELEE